MVDNPKFNRETEIAANTTWLNNRFKTGASAWEKETLERIRAFDKPIVVDLNDVLVNSRHPYEANPQAMDALRKVRSIGSIFIITGAEDWSFQQSGLEDLGLWHEGIVLLSGENFIAPEVEGPTYRLWRPKDETPAFDHAISDFITLSKNKGINYTSEDFKKRSTWKRVGPIFLKNDEIPIIDDSVDACTSNPGMIGIRVRSWELGLYYEEAEGDVKIYQELLFHEDGVPALLGAVDLVEKYYGGK